MSTIKKVYTKKDPIEHVLQRPDMYVGSVVPRDMIEYVIDDYQAIDNFRIEKKVVNISPAIVRIFVELISNAIDNLARSKEENIKMTKIAVNIDMETGETTVWNDGAIVPVVINEEHNIYNHTLIFGHLLSGSNFDDEKSREDISGKNGIGAKACGCFSTLFEVEGADPENKLLFKQTWTNNLKNTTDPVIKPYKLKTGYTKFTYIPDFPRFSLTSYTPDIISVYKRLCVDMAMITKIPVYFNNVLIPINNLLDYARLYTTPADNNTSEENIINIKCQGSDIVLALSNVDEFQAISFANGIFTPLGGIHVEAWSEALFRPIVTKLNKPKKPQINISDVKKLFRLFVVASVNKPVFDSQSKLKLEGPDIKVEVKKTVIQTILKWPVIDRLEDVIRMKEMAVLKKVERKRGKNIYVEGLESANLEGTKKSFLCSLILVEGRSAKTFALSGIGEGFFGRSGRDYFGIYELRGKLLNVRNATPAQIAKNRVVSDIIQSIGLKQGIDYMDDTEYKKLRYGRVVILTDADVDGYHISSLIQNLFHVLFPSLLTRDPPFITSMQTPIARVYGKDKDLLFYDHAEYKNYVIKLNGKKPNMKYLKGLASSKPKEAKEIFGRKMVQFIDDEKTTDIMVKVFHNKYSDLRKKWLEEYIPDQTIFKWEGDKHEVINIPFSEFLDKELIKFSIDDCERSIPNIMDGLKTSQRKVLFTCFARNLKYTGTSKKVGQLSGSVADITSYHHGEQNLYTTIIGMAAAYVGSNNIPLLYRDDIFGSRYSGGKDSGAARYIHTKLEYLTHLIYRSEDNPLLNYLEDDGLLIEPEYYVPIIPMILINGCLGIGTGYSSNIPCYNPIDIIASVKVWLEHDGNIGQRPLETPTEEDILQEDENKIISLLPDIKPWYRGFTGEIVFEADTKYISKGKYERDEKGNVIINELPVNVWTDDYYAFLQKLQEDKKIDNVKTYSALEKVHFIIQENDAMTCDENTLKLTSNIRTSNMVLFTPEGTLRKYKNTDEIIDEYCKVRYGFYIKRKAYMVRDIENKLKYLGNKKRFLEEVRDGVIKLFEEGSGSKRISRKTAAIVEELEAFGYDKELSGNELTEDNDDEKGSGKHGYEYLLRLQINSITAEKINKLKNEIINVKSQLETLRASSEKDLWLRDLKELEDEYMVWLPIIQKEFEDLLEAETSKKIKSKKKKE